MQSVPVASFAGSILSTRDHPTLVVSALQLVELLLAKMAPEYKPSFRREGVLHEIEVIADQKLTPKPKEPEPALPAPSDDPILPPPPAVSLPPTKRTSHVLDPQDAVTLRGRIVRFKYLSGTVELEDAVFAQLRSLVARISEPAATECALKQSLQEIAELFASPNTSVSSFELLQSGLVDGLLEFATVKERTGMSLEFEFSCYVLILSPTVEPGRRQQLLFETFAERSVTGSSTPTSQSPFSILVKKLQESLTRMESFEVVTVSHGIDGELVGNVYVNFGD
jgi:E3 ubiquitin-protein ligase TRIP12